MIARDPSHTQPNAPAPVAPAPGPNCPRGAYASPPHDAPALARGSAWCAPIDPCPYCGRSAAPFHARLSAVLDLLSTDSPTLADVKQALEEVVL